MGDMEHIWVSKAFAAEYKQMESVEEQERAVKRVIEKKRLDLDQENEMLGESLLQFKSVCLVHKKELEKVYQEQAENLYKLWEDFGDVGSMIIRHAKGIAAQIDPIRREVGELSNSIKLLKAELNTTHLHVPEKLVALSGIIKDMDDDTKEILKTLLNK